MSEFIDAEGYVRIEKDAVKELGDIVFVELPAVGTRIEADQEVAVLETTKSAIDVYSPVAGEVVEVNERLVNEPALVATDDGWLFKIAKA